MEFKIDASNKNLKEVNSEIKKAIKNGARKIVVENASHIHGLAAGLKRGYIIINGDSGDYTAALNDGASIIINGNAGKFLADNMTKGTIIVNGNAENGAALYCYGGLVVIRGNAGNFLGALNKGATIIVAGNAGDNVGTYMVGGEIIIVGNVGENVGNWFIRGNIYVGGKWQSLGHNCKEIPLKSEDVRKLEEYFNKYNINADPRKFKKLVPISKRPFYK
ncbi:MAG: tributyrin esterase [archaeon GB-1867-035]|nr:tributyrin esterase [Candidatus Culexmicrobium profundum]